ncbi:hypothetical protein AB0D12_36325 [Streptomyces sp. NPDC048479]|uniref:hypothetical protein n=1 Tax=Streptomyces sp. NPDC048479 TaxID=3154725 RepID=UPI0034370BB3
MRPTSGARSGDFQDNAARYPELEAHLLEHRPWRNPEINAVPMVAGTGAVLDRIARSAAQ